MVHKETKLVFTNEVISRVDLGRLRRELSAIDDFIIQAKVRKSGQQLNLPRTGIDLEELARSNRLNLLVDGDRQSLKTSLTKLYSHAPLLHISFATEPSAVFLKKLIAWLRSEIHPNILLQIGLQPSIAAGCTVQSNSRYFDFSMRQHFEKNRNLLYKELSLKDIANGQ